MTISILTIAVVLPTALVVVAIFAVLWRERTSRREAVVAIASGVTLAAWATLVAALARRGFFQPAPGARVPPVGIILFR